MDTRVSGTAEACVPFSAAMAASIERAAKDYGWRFNDCPSDASASLRVSGEWSDYELSLRMTEDRESIEVRCVFALAPPRERWIEVAKLAKSLNSSFHRGLLELRIDEDHGTYTDWVPMAGSQDPSNRDLIEAMRAAVGTCDMLLFPAFHCVARAPSIAAGLRQDGRGSPRWMASEWAGPAGDGYPRPVSE